MADSLIEVQNLYKQFPDGTVALEDINLTVKEGEFVSLVGPSGCGKSTLLRILAGLETITLGTAIVEGKVPGQGNRDEMAFVFQEPTLLPWRTVLHNVALPLELKGVAKGERLERAREILSLVGLSAREAAYPRELSGGMKMRVSIARALVTKPQLLLMDEPFGALDELTRQRLNDELLTIRSSTAATIVFVTHNVFEAVYLSERIAVMTPYPGRMASLVNVEKSYPRDTGFRGTQEYSKLVYEVLSELEGKRAIAA
ncbi:MAG: ABC transporter ATP-binding protein [Trueperaceae bacterium]